MSNIAKGASPELVGEKIQIIGGAILSRGDAEVKYQVSDYAVIGIDAVFNGVPKKVWLFNRDSEGQRNLQWLPSTNGNVSTSKHRALGSFLLQNRFGGGVFNGQTVVVKNITYYKVDLPGGRFDAVQGKIELSSVQSFQFRSLRAFLKEVNASDQRAAKAVDEKMPVGDGLTIEKIEALGGEILKQFKEKEAEEFTKLQVTQRYIREVNALRMYPALDSAQTKIKDARVWDGALIIDGGPGTGKTTTLIQRVNFLTQKAALKERRPDIPEQILQELDGEKAWLFISPTELLKSYLQNAMSEEGVGAGNSKMKVWSSYLDEIFRSYGLFQASAKKRSPFTKVRNVREPLYRNEWQSIKELFEKFDQFTIHQLKQRSKKKLPSFESKELNFLRQKLEASLSRIGRVNTWIEMFQFLNSFSTEYKKTYDQSVRELNELLDKTAATLTALLKLQYNQLYQELGEWSQQTKSDEPEVDEGEDDEDDEHAETIDTTTGDFESLVFNAARKLIRGAILARFEPGYSFRAELVEWLEKLGGILPQENFQRISELIIIQRKYRKLLSDADKQLLNSIPSFYKGFRKGIIKGEIEVEPRLRYHLEKIYTMGKDKIHPDEMNFLFVYINTKIKSVKNRFVQYYEQSNQKYVQAYNESFRYNIVVDEASDFSLIELLAIESLTHSQYKSITLCGDLMQRMTESGVKDWSSFLEAIDNQGEIHELKVSYRQTPTLLKIASNFYKNVTGRQANYTANTNPSPNEPIPWVKQLENQVETADWLAERILEIHTSYEGRTPSIAIFCVDDIAVRNITKILNDHDGLFDIGINVQGVESTVSMIDASKVCVYNIKNIKGLEFEAAFFVEIDRLEQSEEELLEKYLYVGLSRAAFYLGIR